MKQYTEKELDKKIHTFITSKIDQFPELAHVSQASTKRIETAREKTSVLHDFFAVQLKPSFK